MGKASHDFSIVPTAHMAPTFMPLGWAEEHATTSLPWSLARPAHHCWWFLRRGRTNACGHMPCVTHHILVSLETSSSFEISSKWRLSGGCTAPSGTLFDCRAQQLVCGVVWCWSAEGIMCLASSAVQHLMSTQKVRRDINACYYHGCLRALKCAIIRVGKVSPAQSK